MVHFFPTPSPAFIICRLFDDDHSDQCEGTPHCRFDLHLSNEWCWASFHVKSIGTDMSLADANIPPLVSPQWLHGAKPAWSKVSIWNAFRTPSLRCSDKKGKQLWKAFTTLWCTSTNKHKEKLSRSQNWKDPNSLSFRTTWWGRETILGKHAEQTQRAITLCSFSAQIWQKFFQLHLKKSVVIQ